MGTAPLPKSVSRAAPLYLLALINTLSVTKQLSHPVLVRGALHLLEHQ